MLQTVLSRIDWRYLKNQSNYLYGTQIDFEENSVRISNPVLSSGKAIKTFYSSTNYQSERYSPELPLLIPGEKYRFKIDMQTVPQNRFFIEMTFLNRRKEVIEVSHFREVESDFICPEDTYQYTLKIISAGCTEMIFESLTIYQGIVDSIIKNDNQTIKTNRKAKKEFELIRPLLRTD